MEKRPISILIPYCTENGNTFVFLQKRDKDAKRLPGFFGFFGGGIEIGETAEEALKREIQEELGIDAYGANFFSKYEFYGSIKNVFTLQVENKFGDKIVLGEGEYGKFFTENEVAEEKLLIDEDKLVLKNFFGKIKHDNPFA